jgi:nitrogen fixation protein FixH
MSHALVDPPRSGRPLTGRTVFLCLLGLFGVVFAANFVMVRVAISTFGGVETTSSYKAGLAFKQEVAAAQAQAERHWNVEARVTPGADGGTLVLVNARDGAGMPVSGVTVKARLAHPADSRKDHAVALVEGAPGVFRGDTAAITGSWDIVIDILGADGERRFRSKTRLHLR